MLGNGAKTDSRAANGRHSCSDDLSHPADQTSEVLFGRINFNIAERPSGFAAVELSNNCGITAQREGGRVAEEMVELRIPSE